VAVSARRLANDKFQSRPVDRSAAPEILNFRSEQPPTFVRAKSNDRS
jgi:hypothetical protein